MRTLLCLSFFLAMAVGCGGGNTVAPSSPDGGEVRKDPPAASTVVEKPAVVRPVATEPKESTAPKEPPPPPPKIVTRAADNTPASRARAKWDAKIAPYLARWESDRAAAIEAYKNETANLAARVKKAEQDLEKAKGSPLPPAFAKKVTEAEENIRRAKEAVAFAANRVSENDKRETKKLLERREKELEAAKVAHITLAETDLKAAREAKQPPFREPAAFVEPRFPPDQLRLGDVAKLGSGPGRVSLFEVFQIIDDNSALIKDGDDLYWGEFNTRGLADKDIVKLEGLVECTGSRQYVTRLNTTKTVRILHEYR